MIFTSYFKIYNYSGNTFTKTSMLTSGWTLIIILWSPVSLIGPSGSWTSLLSISIRLLLKASEISLVPTEPYKAPVAAPKTNAGAKTPPEPVM